MSRALHLNLLNPYERKSSSPVRAHIILPAVTGICLGFIVLWVLLDFVQLAILAIANGRVTDEIDTLSTRHSIVSSVKSRYRDLQAEVSQFSYFANGRVPRSELIAHLAYAIPEGITLTSLSIPTPPDQKLRPPPGSKEPPLQGPKETFERTELRIAGNASTEQDVFQLLNALKGDAFTNLLVIVERPKPPQRESPRVVSFRQNSFGKTDGVFFDLIYDLKPREFAK